MSTEPKMTPWFRGVPPVHEGVYEIKWPGASSDGDFYAHWGARGWGIGARYLLEAKEGAGKGSNPDWYHINGCAWRGLAEKPA